MIKNSSKILFFFTFIGIFLWSNLHAQDSIGNSDRVALYNFQVKQQFSSNGSSSKKRSGQYYSFIIPHTIFKILSKKYGHEVVRSLEIPQEGQNKEDLKKRFITMGKNSRINFLVTGTCTITPKRIKIETTIFDTKGREIRSFTSTSNETGVILQKIIEEITYKINSDIAKIKKLNKKKFAPSPIASLFGNHIVLGIRTGYLWMLRSYRDKYKDTYFISPEIGYRIDASKKIILGYDYISPESRKGATPGEDFYSHAGTLGFSVEPQLNKKFGFILSMQVGVVRSKISVNPKNLIIDSPDETKKSFSPYMAASCGISWAFNSSIKLKIGGDFRNIFYDEEQLSMPGVYIGMEGTF